MSIIKYKKAYCIVNCIKKWSFGIFFVLTISIWVLMNLAVMAGENNMNSIFYALAVVASFATRIMLYTLAVYVVFYFFARFIELFLNSPKPTN